jgi:hypothetical protein
MQFEKFDIKAFYVDISAGYLMIIHFPKNYYETCDLTVYASVINAITSSNPNFVIKKFDG